MSDCRSSKTYMRSSNDDSHTGDARPPQSRPQYRLLLDDLPPSPRLGAALCWLLCLLFRIVVSLTLPFRYLSDRVLNYHYVYILTVSDVTQHRMVGVYGNLPAAKVAVTEVLRSAEYKDQSVRLAFPEYGKDEMGAVSHKHQLEEEEGATTSALVVVMVQKMCVRRSV